MKDEVLDLIVELIPVILIIVFIGAVIIGARKQDKKEWNNGYCECGGHWVYEEAIGHAYTTTYMYRCDKCGKTIEVWRTDTTEVKTNEK